MRARNVVDAPGKAPQAVGSLADLLAQIVHELNSERAAAEEQEPRTPIGISAVKAQAKPQASRMERDGAFGMGRWARTPAFGRCAWVQAFGQGGQAARGASTRGIDARPPLLLTEANGAWRGLLELAMKAMLSKSVGGPQTLVLEDMPDPTPGAGEVVLDVKACGVNFPDLLMI